jgi:putative oxidoreductase
MKALFRTHRDYLLTFLRLVLGVTFLAHGSQKVFGWFGGFGFNNTMQYMEHLGIPAVFAFLAIAAEFAGGLGLIFGFLSRIAAFGIGVEMLVAIAKFHAANGFFMNWAGTQKGEGFEYHLLTLALIIAILVRGAGALSVDGWIARSLRGTRLGVRHRSPVTA